MELTHPGHPRGTEKNNPGKALYRGRSTRDPGGDKACTYFHSSRPRRRKAKPCITKPPALPNFWQERGTATLLHTSEGSDSQLCPHGAQTCGSQQTPTRTACSHSRPPAPGPPFHACLSPHRFAERMQACGGTPEGLRLPFLPPRFATSTLGTAIYPEYPMARLPANSARTEVPRGRVPRASFQLFFFFFIKPKNLQSKAQLVTRPLHSCRGRHACGQGTGPGPYLK